MNKIFLALAALSACSAAFAQEDSSFWRVYDTKKQEEQNVEVKHFIPMAIIGKDDRQEITGQARGFAKAAVVLEMQHPDGEWSECSGAMVGKNIVLTAAHCLTRKDNHFYQAIRVTATGLKGNNQTDQKKAVALISNTLKEKLKHAKSGKAEPAPDADTSLTPEDIVFPSANAAKLWAPSRWTRTKSYDDFAAYDYGLIVLDSNLGEQTGWLNMAAKSDKALMFKGVILLGRGGDKPSESLWLAEGRIGRIDSPFIYHNADMLGGNSGGPIVLKDNPYTIIALNNFYEGGEEYLPDGEYVNGGLRISDDIISAVNRNKTRK